jgi:hypothetical protein
MSFLDRFHNKISTVTASGQLKKAEGSEEIRVGPSIKRKPAPPPNNSNVHYNQVRASAIRGAGAAVVSNTGGLSARSTDLPYTESNNSYASSSNQAQQPTSSSFTTKSIKSASNQEACQFENEEFKSKEDTDRDQSFTPQTCRSSPDEYSSSSRNTTKSNPSRNKATSMRSTGGGSNSNNMKECISPREINEAKVHTKEDQLYFSRRRRPVQYEPCDLKQYKKEKPNGYFELGKLQPDLNSEELIQKRANAERIKAFSKNLREINKTTTTTSSTTLCSEKNIIIPTIKSTREKAKEFAKKIPKPKAPKRMEIEEPNSNKQSTNASKLRQAGVRCSSADAKDGVEVKDEDGKDRYRQGQDEDEEEEVDAVTRELQELQARHAASKAQVEAIMRKA